MNELKIDSAVLYDLCKQANQAVKKNAIIPILECFKIDVNPDGVSVSATDLQNYIKVSSDPDTEVDQDFSFCPSADLFLNTLSTINPPQQITITSNDKVIGIKTRDGLYESGASDPNEFPMQPISPEGGTSANLNSDFTNAFDMVSSCCGNDPMKMAFTGVLLEQIDGELKIVATSGHIMAKHLSSNSFNENVRKLLPKHSTSFIKNNFVSDYQLKITPKHAIFSDENTTYSVRLIDANFPDYERIIPKDNPFEATINRFDLISVLKRVSIYADAKTSEVVLRFSENSVNISSQFAEMNNSSNENLSIDYDGDDMTVSFNANILSKLLYSIHGDDITFTLKQANSAATIYSNKEDNRSTHLIMPTFVQ